MTRYLGFAVVACGVLCCQAQPSRTPTRLEAEYYVAVYAQHYGVPIAFVRAIVSTGIWLASMRHLAQGRGRPDAVNALNGRTTGSTRPLQR